MARTLILSTAGLTLAALAACASPPADAAADVEAVKQVSSMEAQYINSADVDGSLSILTSDTKMLPPNESMIVGTDAAREWLEAFHELFSTDLGYSEKDVTVSGDWAIERYQGMMTMTPKDGGDPVVENLKGVHVYQRQPDGSWKIAVDVWNSNTPLEGM